MKKTTIITLMALGLASLPMQAQTTVEPFIPGSTVEGVSYFLPRTVFRVVVEAEKTITRPGEFCRYAEHYLRMPNVPTEERVAWSIKRIMLEPYGVPDKNKAYSIKLKGRTVAPLVGLSKDGLLLSINTDAEETQLPEVPQGVPAAPLDNPRAYMNQEMLTASSTSKMAELCAQEIYDIRESRNALVRGEADNLPKDGKQLQLMLEQLDRQVRALESLFCGTTQTSTEVFTLRYEPTQETERDVLFRFSQKLGAVGYDDLAGEPIYVSVKKTETLPAPIVDEAASKKKAKLMPTGVFYNVPVRTRITLFTPEKEYCSLETPMGQFGSVEILSATLFDKKTTTKVSFFQNTGGVKDVME